MLGCQKQCRECSIGMPDQYHLAQMECVDKRCKILRIRHCGIAGLRRIIVWIVIAATVSDGSVVPRKWPNLIGPVAAIAQRSMHEDHRDAPTLFYVVQGDSVTDVGCENVRCWSTDLRECATGEKGESNRKAEKTINLTSQAHSALYLRERSLSSSLRFAAD